MAATVIAIPAFTGQSDNLAFDCVKAGAKADSRFVMLSDGGKLVVTGCGVGDAAPLVGTQAPPDLSGFSDDFNLSQSEAEAGDRLAAADVMSWSRSGSVYSIEYLGTDKQPNSISVDIQSTTGSGPAAVALTCFAAGTMIETDLGLSPVEALSVGDFVKCGDGKSRPIRWMSRKMVLEPEMKQHPKYRPIRIRKGALYDNVPNADLVVSPQHRILINDWRAELLFGEEEVLVPAVHLLNDTDILRDFEATEVTYYQFMFDRHHTVFSNNVESESFFPGVGAIEGIDEDAREALYKAFPALKEDGGSYGETCCPALNAYEALAMVGL